MHTVAGQPVRTRASALRLDRARTLRNLPRRHHPQDDGRPGVNPLFTGRLARMWPPPLARPAPGRPSPPLPDHPGENVSGTAASDGLMLSILGVDGKTILTANVPPYNDFLWQNQFQLGEVHAIRINRWSVDSGEYNRGYLAGMAYAYRKYREALKEVRKEISGG